MVEGSRVHLIDLARADGLLECIETAWNDSTTRRPARTCFADLAVSLAHAGLPLELAELARITVAMWAVLGNGGRIPTLDERPHEINSLGDALGRHWPLIADTLLEGAQLLRRLDGPERLEPDPLALLMTWRLMGRQLLDDQSRLAAESSYRERLDQHFFALARRWSTFARPSDPEFAETFEHTLHQLGNDWAAMRSAEPESGFDILTTRMMSRVA